MINVRRLLARLTRGLERRTIHDRMGEDPYMTRYYVRHSGRRSPGIYLHHFHRGDSEPELHSHPWRWAFSLILAGGYVEERRSPKGVIRRRCGPWSANVLRSTDFHRVDLLEHDAWTLFVTGPKFAGWGFWRRETGQFWSWRTFINELRAPKGRAANGR